jgi:PIN domain nuclease of toxin-antitoxin system
MGQSCVILLDTHVVLWLTTDLAKLSGKARSAIEDTRRNAEGLAICGITFLELATLSGKGRILPDIGVESFLHEVESRFVVLPITARACARAISLPARYPNDPADRIIGATALVEGLLLVTGDREIRRSKAVRTIW